MPTVLRAYGKGVGKKPIAELLEGVKNGFAFLGPVSPEEYKAWLGSLDSIAKEQNLYVATLVQEHAMSRYFEVCCQHREPESHTGDVCDFIGIVQVGIYQRGTRLNVFTTDFPNHIVVYDPVRGELDPDQLGTFFVQYKRVLVLPFGTDPLVDWSSPSRDPPTKRAIIPAFGGAPVRYNWNVE
ncbi:hypothetical protein CMO91_06080 [Candidatus Woesearchaeota archaeon]|nr:hypothetical protein [Candidatus Woesearchaeota archaeon]|tara:strand:- start:13 stop:561 length:549 start_codon:yes stop_codon:yes gene_type:complete